VEALALKTARWRKGDRKFVLCDTCHSSLAGSVWVVAGQETVAARCERCGSFFNVAGMAKLRPAQAGGIPSEESVPGLLPTTTIIGLTLAYLWGRIDPHMSQGRAATHLCTL
jgi:hypothetical protein